MTRKEIGYRPRGPPAYSMSELADLLRRKREGLGVSVRALAGSTPGISQQSLSNYEGAKSIPSDAKLRVLAKCYEIPLDRLRRTRARSLGLREPVDEPMFLHALDFSEDGDHLVIVAQQSLIAGRSDLATKMLQYADRGLLFTYVTYAPRIALTGKAGAIWSSNHDDAAWRIAREASRSGQEQLTDQVRYLCIDQPDEVDFAFLRAFGSTSYLRRGGAKEDALARSRIWSVSESPKGDPWWCPLPYDVLCELDMWLTKDCGLLLPGAVFDEPKTIGSRTVTLLSLEEFIARRLGRSIESER